jgi:hypothetical protein
MAFLLHHFWPAGTEDQYRTMLAAVHPADGLPEERSAQDSNLQTQ